MSNHESDSDSSKALLREVIIFLVALLLGLSAFGLYMYGKGSPLKDVSKKDGFGSLIGKLPDAKDIDIKQFASVEEFHSYIEEGQASQSFGFNTFNSLAAPMADFAEESVALSVDSAIQTRSESGGASRVSETNVQVKGIDEPDIIKTDGSNIFFSGYFSGEPIGIPEPLPIDSDFEIAQERSSRPYFRNQETKVISAFPPSALDQIANIEESGELLLSDDVLMVFYGNGMSAYDVSQPDNPQALWDKEIDRNNYIMTSRLMNGELYLVTRNYVSYGSPCPMPLFSGTNQLTIPCTDVFFPSVSFPADSTFTVLKINPQDGELLDSVSFVGNANTSVIYMSENNIFATYSYQASYADYMFDFVNQSASDIFSEETLTKLKELQELDISNQAKQIELNVVLEKFYASLDEDEALKVRNQIANRMEDYLTENGRALETTGIVKIDTNNLDIAANGTVPGSPLNQFSMDEYKNNLRIATTVGAFGFRGGESVNDLYILDKKLNIIGSALDMGIDERIFSVRFMEDKGYIVTFRQIDPFYVLDLSNPKSPEIKGELKIPGFSSYLHPLEENKILGVGREDSQVKLSVFDVSNPSDPIESDKYLLDEYWSDVQNTHHAFLQDDKHKIFFIPGGQGGYIFSYDGDLEIVKSVSERGIKRALFLDDYLYLLGENGITVLNENDWQTVNEFAFE